jgi:hypothetical protein
MCSAVGVLNCVIGGSRRKRQLVAEATRLMTAMAIKCSAPVSAWPPVCESAKVVSAGGSIPIAVMAYLRDERVDRREATDMCSKTNGAREQT